MPYATTTNVTAMRICAAAWAAWNGGAYSLIGSEACDGQDYWL